MLSVKQKLKIIIFIGSVLLSNVGFAQSFYIAPNGSDEGIGTVEDPLQSIEKALQLIKFKKQI